MAVPNLRQFRARRDVSVPNASLRMTPHAKRPTVLSDLDAGAGARGAVALSRVSDRGNTVCRLAPAVVRSCEFLIRQLLSKQQGSAPLRRSRTARYTRVVGVVVPSSASSTGVP